MVKNRQHLQKLWAKVKCPF